MSKLLLFLSDFHSKTSYFGSQHTFENIPQISVDRGENVIICIFMSNVKQEELPSTLQMITKTD